MAHTLKCRDKTNEKSAADHLVSGVPSISGWQRPRQQTAGSEQLNIEHSAQIQVQPKVHQYKHALVLISWHERMFKDLPKMYPMCALVHTGSPERVEL